MDELTTRKAQLPDTLEDLSQFVLVNKAKLDAYRVKLRAVNRLSDAQEIREQTLQEMQDISSALIAAETRIGEILLNIPKQTGNQYTSASSEGMEKAKTKAEVTEEMGYTRHEVSDYQRMAQNPAVVSLVIEQAEKEGRVVSHAQVMKQIKAKDAEIERLSRNNDSLDRANKRLAKEANQGGKVIEKTVEVEVFPDDYEETKKQLRMYKGDNERLNREYKERNKELQDARLRVKELEGRSAEAEMADKAIREAEYFEIAAYDFIKRCGGYVWLCERVNDMPDGVSKKFKKALFQLNAMTTKMLEQTGGYIDGE